MNGWHGQVVDVDLSPKGACKSGMTKDGGAGPVFFTEGGGVLRALFLGFSWHETPIKLVFFKGEAHEALRFLRFREIEF